VRITILGRNLPGSTFAGASNVHVAVQVGRAPEGPVPGDAESARWDVDVRLVDQDFRGPAVHGRRGERFVYLTWGSPSGDDWGMFRRAKLMLDRVDAALVREAEATDRSLVAVVDLTDERGCPRCARVDPPAITWSVGDEAAPAQASGARSL
jgi:hypothetical protein